MPIILLFGRAHEFLGEISVDDAGLSHVTFSPTGEIVCGAEIEGWRVHGIPVRAHEDKVLPDGTMHSISHTEYYQVRSSMCEQAIRWWAGDQGYFIVTLPEQLLPYWHRLAGLPLEPEELFASIEAIKRSPHRLLSAWDQALDQMRTITKYAAPRKVALSL